MMEMGERVLLHLEANKLKLFSSNPALRLRCRHIQRHHRLGVVYDDVRDTIPTGDDTADQKKWLGK